jgi:RNA polymerase sigma-70 factor, ECF subfamily
MTDSAVQEFLPRAEPYRRELLAHCYRMLGSVHDAEDLVQETYLRAWRAYDRFEERSSLRTWLYRIATTACLTALESRSRRPLPSGLGAPSSDPEADLAEQPEVPWLEPIPDAMVAGQAADPATTVVSRDSLRLALIAALQHLPPRQRTVLILREALKWPAADVADLLGTTTAAVNSSLQRARAQISAAAPAEDAVAAPATARQRELLRRYVAAFEAYDVTALVDLFTSDAVWEMPPFTGWYQTPGDIGRLIATQCPAKTPGDLRLIPTEANGQPAFGMYLRDSAGSHGAGSHGAGSHGAGSHGADSPGAGSFSAFQLQVVHVAAAGIDHVAAFFDTSLFATFGLPLVLPAGS